MNTKRYKDDLAGSPPNYRGYLDDSVGEGPHDCVPLYEEENEDEEFADVPRFDDVTPSLTISEEESEPRLTRKERRKFKREGFPIEQKEPESPEEQGPRHPSRFEKYVGQVLSGNILTRTEVRRQYPYLFFMAVLMFLYIANIFHMQKLHRRHDALTQQVKELRAKSLTVSSIRMMSTRQSEILKELERRNIPLKESLTPPQVIEKK